MKTDATEQDERSKDPECCTSRACGRNGGSRARVQRDDAPAAGGCSRDRGGACVGGYGCGDDDVNVKFAGHFGGATDAVVVSCDCVYVEQAGDAARLLHRRGVFEPKTRRRRVSRFQVWSSGFGILFFDILF